MGLTSRNLASNYARWTSDKQTDMNKGNMDRVRTDFLCPSSSFLMGAGSVMSLAGHLYSYNTSDDPDRLAIASDWRMVGQDISDAVGAQQGRFKQEALSG